jgi:hypothetical protein
MWKEHKSSTIKKLGARRSYISKAWKISHTKKTLRSCTIESRKMKTKKQ